MTTITPHDNILIVSSITNDIDIINVVLLVVKVTASVIVHSSRDNSGNNAIC